MGMCSVVFNEKKRVMSPVDGDIIKRMELNNVINEKGLGECVIVRPTSDLIFAPCEGIVTDIIMNKDEITIKLDEDLEISLYTKDSNIENCKVSMLVDKDDYVLSGQPLMDFAIDDSLKEYVIVSMCKNKSYSNLFKTNSEKVSSEEFVMEYQLS